MQLNFKSIHVLSIVLYFCFAYGVLFLYVSDNYFCSSARTGQARGLVTAKLALACTIWNVVASVCGITLRKYSRWWGAIAATLIAGLGFASIPFWIYRGHGRFLFANTWADVSCFFTEGYGEMFPIVIAPLLAAATLLREWLVLRGIRSCRIRNYCVKSETPSASSTRG